HAGATVSTPNRIRVTLIMWLALNDLQFPRAPAEPPYTYAGIHNFGGSDGHNDSLHPPSGGMGKNIRQGQLEEPIAQQIDPCWCSRIAGAVERLHHHRPYLEEGVCICRISKKLRSNHDHSIVGREEYHHVMVKE